MSSSEQPIFVWKLGGILSGLRGFVVSNSSRQTLIFSFDMSKFSTRGFMQEIDANEFTFDTYIRKFTTFVIHKKTFHGIFTVPGVQEVLDN